MDKCGSALGQLTRSKEEDQRSGADAPVVRQGEATHQLMVHMRVVAALIIYVHFYKPKHTIWVPYVVVELRVVLDTLTFT